MVRASRRGNAVAAILIIIFLLVGATVITYTMFLPRERLPDSQQAYSEAQNILDRAFIKSGDQLLQNGFSNETNVWYCNKPFPPNQTEVGAGFSHYTAQNLRRVDPDGFFSGSDRIVLSEPTVVWMENSDASVTINVTNLTVSIYGLEENRSVDISTQTPPPANYDYYYRTLSAWMGCNAGNLTQSIVKKMQMKPCQFESCCCGYFPMSGPTKDAIKREYGISEKDVENALNASVESLNNLFAGSSSCFVRPARQGKVVCKINYNESIRRVENEVIAQYVEKPCGNARCAVTPLWGHNGTPMEWSSEWLTEPVQGCPERPPLNVRTDIIPDVETAQRNDEVPESAASRHFLMALHKRAAANALVTCRVFNDEGLEEKRFSVRLRINIKNVCAIPPDEPAEVDNNFCVGGGGGACPCPTRTDCGECGASTPICDEFCVMIDEGSCIESCGELPPGGSGSGSGQGSGTGPGPGTDEGTPDETGTPAPEQKPCTGGCAVCGGCPGEAN